MEAYLHQLLVPLGFGDRITPILAGAAAVLALGLLSALIGLFCRTVLFRLFPFLIARSQTKWDDYLFSPKFLGQLTWTIVFSAAYALLWVLFGEDSVLFPWLRKLLLSGIAVSAAASLSSFLANGADAIQAIHGENQAPVKSYAQVAKIIIGLVAFVLVIAFLSDQSPVGILSGIGALTAVLLFVFKDSLLGFLASLQISSQDMVKIGDWIELPSQGIDGEVKDISLNVIKIRNWDNTVTSIPSYNLVSGSFKNWRHMQNSGGRRVKRSLPLDSAGLRLLDGPARAALAELPGVAAWLGRCDAAGRSATNLGAYRAWAQAFLDSHPGVHQGMGRTVRHLEVQGRGIPLELVFFSQAVGGAEFESLVAEVFEELYAALPRFGLALFQEGKRPGG